MPVYIENITSEVAVFDGDLPLSEAQIEKLVRIVFKRLEESQREGKQGKEATGLRREAMPKMQIED
ncbi:MAG: hypothetical protein PVG96_18210 [Desulfobacterales bacterium]|jgi:hypothetical protein